MSDTNKRPRLKGKRLDFFCEKVAELRPGLDIKAIKKEWNKIHDASKRNSHIRAFLYTNGFTENQIWDIERYAFKIRIPWKMIGKWTAVLITISALSYVCYQFNRFYNFTRVYTAGNNIPVFSNTAQTETREVQMDIYGESFGAVTKASFSSMLLVDSSGAIVTVKKDSFMDFLFKNSGEGYVNKEDIVFTRQEYDQYCTLFKALKGDSNLVNVDLKTRKIIYDLVNGTSALNNSVLADDYPKIRKSGFAKLLSVSQQDTSYIFLRLKTPATVRNLTISHSLKNGSRFNDLIRNDGRTITETGLFKKEEGTMPFPDVFFSPFQSSTQWKSVGTPYYIFNPQ